MSRIGGNETISFEYNENGLRTKKTSTVTGITEYTLHGKNVVHMKNGNDEMHFFYGADNKPVIVVYNGASYEELGGTYTLGDKMSELLKKKGEAYHLLDQIKPENAKVLLEHFFSGKTVDALSHEIHVCKRHAQRRLNDAILEFQAVLNNPTGITNLLTTRMSLQSDDGSLR